MYRPKGRLGPWCAYERERLSFDSCAPLEDHPLAARRESSEQEGWIFEVLYCDPKGSTAFLQILSTKGQSVLLCWAYQKPKGRASEVFLSD